MLELSFEAEIIHWRGPAPFFYAPLPQAMAGDFRSTARRVSYGWGMIPVDAVIADVAFSTTLFPKDGTYLLPLKADLRKRCGITAGDRVKVDLTIG